MRASHLVMAALALPLAAAAQFTFGGPNDLTLDLMEKGKPVLAYVYAPYLKPGMPENMKRSTYLHPVYAPDGTVLTDDFNSDHPHHRGISWMWPVVVVDGKSYDLWTLGGIRQRFVRWTRREANAREALLGVENGWYIGDRKVVKENVEIRVLPARDNVRTMYFVLKFEADGQPVEIAGTTEGQKGFGGFCFRFSKPDGAAKGTTLRTDHGVIPKDGVKEPTRWAAVEGLWQGKPESGRIDDDPANPGYPRNGWLLRHNFPFMNVSYPGLPHVTLEPGKPLTLRYKVTLASGAAAKAGE